MLRTPLTVLGIAVTVFVIASVLKGDRDHSGKDLGIMVRRGDAEMEAARAEARKHLPEFVSALEKPTPTQTNFLVKARFEDGGAVEYLWLNELSHADGKFTGKVNNDTRLVKNVAFGDQVTVGDDSVTDWMFFDNGEMRGGYSVKVLMERQAHFNQP
ncbi:MAG: DUF2314 domain-containing protein [Pirellulales bacterium]